MRGVQGVISVSCTQSPSMPPPPLAFPQPPAPPLPALTRQYLKNNEGDPVAGFQLVLDMQQLRLECASSHSGGSGAEGERMSEGGLRRGGEGQGGWVCSLL